MAAGSRFCNNCGTAVGAVAAMAPVGAAAVAHGVGAMAARLDEPERTLFSIRPSFLFVGVRYVLAALVWIVVTALISLVVSYFAAPWWVGAILVVFAGIVLFVNPVVAHVRRQMNLYTLTNHKLEVQRGLISTTVRNIPLGKVQDVTVTASIFERLLGLGNIIIDNASEEGGQVVISTVPNAKHYADLLLREVQRRN